MPAKGNLAVLKRGTDTIGFVKDFSDMGFDRKDVEYTHLGSVIFEETGPGLAKSEPFKGKLLWDSTSHADLFDDGADSEVEDWSVVLADDVQTTISWEGWIKTFKFGSVENDKAIEVDLVIAVKAGYTRTTGVTPFAPMSIQPETTIEETT